jgi:hypothetical protein
MRVIAESQVPPAAQRFRDKGAQRVGDAIAERKVPAAAQRLRGHRPGRAAADMIAASAQPRTHAAPDNVVPPGRQAPSHPPR